MLGSANMDLTVRAPRLPQPGETVLGGSFYQSPGGKGANQAVAAARAGALPVVFLAAVGNDAHGHELRTCYQSEGIDCEHLTVVRDEPTGVALITVDHNGENAISVASGANLLLTPEVVNSIPDDVFRRATVALACLESPIETVQVFLERAKKFGATTILNPAPMPEDATCVIEQLLPWADAVTPNRLEAAAITGMPDPADAAKVLREHIGKFVITLGSEGCLVVHDQTDRIPARQAQAIDTTGAGDAFNAALAVALTEKRQLVDAARWANVAATLSVERQGAGPSFASRDQIVAACEQAM